DLSPHIWPCSSWGLPCRSRFRKRGGLLPHLFTLAREGGLFSVALSVASRSLALRPGVTWQLVQGARTFLGTRTCSNPATVRPTILLKYKRADDRVAHSVARVPAA